MYYGPNQIPGVPISAPPVIVPVEHLDRISQAIEQLVQRFHPIDVTSDDRRFGIVGNSEILTPITRELEVEIARVEQPDGRAELLTVFMDVVDLTDAVGSTPIVEGRVIYGVGNHAARARFDVAKGMCFSVPASALKINAIVPASTSEPTPSEVRVGAFIARSVRPAASVVYSTQYSGDVASGDSATFTIPDKAVAVMVLRSNADAVPYLLHFRDREAAPVVMGGSSANAGVQSPFVPIPRRAYTILLTNVVAAAAASTRFTVVFQLAL